MFEKVFYGLFEAVAAKAQGTHKFRFKNKLVSLDSTVIDLCLSMYDWVKYRRTKGAVKLHLVLDHDGYLPCFGLVTDGNVADVKAAWRIAFTPGTIVVDDRGSNDYRLFAEWTDAGIYFVTRMKDNALFEIVEGMMSRTARLRPANCFRTAADHQLSVAGCSLASRIITTRVVRHEPFYFVIRGSSLGYHSGAQMLRLAHPCHVFFTCHPE